MPLQRRLESLFWAGSPRPPHMLVKTNTLRPTGSATAPMTLPNPGDLEVSGWLGPLPPKGRLIAPQTVNCHQQIAVVKSPSHSQNSSEVRLEEGWTAVPRGSHVLVGRLLRDPWCRLRRNRQSYSDRWRAAYSGSASSKRTRLQGRKPTLAAQGGRK